MFDALRRIVSLSETHNDIDKTKDVIEAKTIDSLTFYLNKFKTSHLSNTLQGYNKEEAYIAAQGKKFPSIFNI